MAKIIQTIDGVVTNKFYVDKAVLKFGRTEKNQVQIDDGLAEMDKGLQDLRIRGA